jgi:hypothetical protein
MPVPTVGVHLNDFFNRNWKSSGQNRFSKQYIVICYFVCCQTGRHFKSSRRELANVRIKRMSNVINNEVFFLLWTNFSLLWSCELLLDTKTFDILSLWKRQGSGSGHAFFISSGWNRNSKKPGSRPELTAGTEFWCTPSRQLAMSSLQKSLLFGMVAKMKTSNMRLNYIFAHS